MQAEATARYEDYLAARRALVTAPSARRAEAQAEMQGALDDFHNARSQYIERNIDLMKLSTFGDTTPWYARLHHPLECRHGSDILDGAHPMPTRPAAR
jgi:hypothetical protein